MGYSEELWLACGKYSKSLAAVIICTVAVIVEESQRGFTDWAGNIRNWVFREGWRMTKTLPICKAQGALRQR